QHLVGVRRLLHLGQPKHRWQRATDLIQHVDRAGLVLPELLDQRDPLLQLRASLLELLNLRNDRVEPRGFLLRAVDLGVEARRLGRQDPAPPTDEQRSNEQNQRADERQLLTELERQPLRRLRPPAAEKIDFDHRSLPRRSARPTATAAAERTVSMSSA